MSKFIRFVMGLLQKREKGKGCTIVKRNLLLLAFILGCSTNGQQYVFAQNPQYNDSVPASYQPLSESSLDKLVSPVALYPDPLLAQVFAASAHADQLAAASVWLSQNDPSQLAQQSWDPSVIAIAGFPSVLQMMNSERQWTAQLGLAFQNQQTGVMKAVQRMRAKAQAQGNLNSNAQQKIISDGSTIAIVPAQTDAIYVPTYDSTVVYSQPANAYSPAVAFGAGMAVGSLMSSSTTNWYTGTVVYPPPVYPVPYGAAAVYHGPYGGTAYGTGHTYATGYGGYGAASSWSGSTANGNQWNSNYAEGRTATGGAYSARSSSTQWNNGAATGSYSSGHVGPYSAGADRGWGYSNGNNEAGAFSKSGVTQNGAYNVSGSGWSNGSQSGGSITASGVNKEGNYQSKTWTDNDGSWSSSGKSGNLFSGSQNSWNSASEASSRGWASRFGSGDEGGGSRSWGNSGGWGGSSRSFGGGFGGGGFGGGGFGGSRGGFRR